MDYKKLNIWKEANQLCIDTYKITNSFPKHEMFNMISQLRRAALSVPTNIVEGYGRMYNKEFYKFLSYSRGSAMEVQYLLFVSKELGYINIKEYEDKNDKCDKIIRMITKFMASMQTNN